MSNVSKRRREGSRTKIKTMGDHKEFLKRITKTLYYGHLPTLPCLSLPVTEMSCSVWSETQRGRSLRRLHADAAARVARGACVSPCALVLALLYLERLQGSRPEYVQRVAPHDLFLISLMVGNKFLQDDGEDDEVISAEWAASGLIDLKQLHKLELEFLDAIDWNIYVSEDSFEEGLSRVERAVALRQARARGFFTYGDLRAACDAAARREVLRALAAACLAISGGLAALLTSALVVLPALHLIAKATDMTLHRAVITPTPYTHTFLNNATMDFTIDALSDRLDTSRVMCCAEWTRQMTRPSRNRSQSRVRVRADRVEPWPEMYWRTLLNPVQRWLERVAEYAELATNLHSATGYDKSDIKAPQPQRAPHCVRQWLDLSKLSALLVTVSDR